MIPGLLLWSIAVLAPVTLAFFGFFALRLGASVHAAQEREMRRAVHELIFNVNRELTAAFNVLTTLRQSENIDAMSGNAEGISRAVGFDIALLDLRQGRQMIKTRFSTAATLDVPSSINEVEIDALHADKQVVFDVFGGPDERRFMVGVGMPITGIETADHLLVAFLPVDRFADVFKQIRLNDDWTVELYDRKGNIIARSRDHDRFVGQTTVLTDFIKPTSTRQTISGNNDDNVPIIWTYDRSELTGWVATVEVPQITFREPSYFAFGGLLMTGVVIVIGAITMATRTSRRFGRAIDQLRHTISVIKQNEEHALPTAHRSHAYGGISQILAAASAELLAVEHQRQFVASAADIGTWEWNLTDQKLVWSDRYREIIGVSRTVEARYDRLFELVHPEDRKIVKDAIGNSARQGDDFDCEFRIFRASDGVERWIHIKARVDRARAGNPARMLAAVVDTTARKAAELEIQDSAARLKVLVETVSDGVILTDGTGHILLFNPACEQLFGYSADEVIGQGVQMVLPLRDGVGWHASDEKDPHIGLSRAVEGQHRNGTAISVLLSIGEVTRDGRSLFIVIVHDLTLQKQAERERNELRRQLMRPQENERLRLAHDLHDEVGQLLAAMMLDLQRLESVIGEPGRNFLNNLHSRLDNMGQSLHQVARQLRHLSIDDLGLKRALADFVFEWGERFGIAVDLQCVNCDLDRLSGDLTTSLYRICQEALTNIAKHAAGASQVGVIVDKLDDTLRLTIEDNGCGFDVNDVMERSGKGTLGGLGLAGMRERLALFGGEMQIESSAGVGTTIYVKISTEPPEPMTWLAKHG